MSFSLVQINWGIRFVIGQERLGFIVIEIYIML